MARRGENIHKRKDGRWEGRYIKARTPEGKIQWGYIYGTAYAEVKRVLIQKKAEAGFYNLKRTDLTFEVLAEVWLHSLRNSIKECRSEVSHLSKTSVTEKACLLRYERMMEPMCSRKFHKDLTHNCQKGRSASTEISLAVRP